jgi:pimeloyl-ACP methyl ester carboxylesterase
MDAVTGIFLIHGGIWEDMDAERFWIRPGVVAGLRDRGFDVLAPDRLPQPLTWYDEVGHLERLLPADPVTLMAGSNGCTVAIRLALARPERAARLLLAWPPVAGDARSDAWSRTEMTRQGAADATIDGMLAGQTLRGVTDAELAGLRLPVAVLPPPQDTPFHKVTTVDALLRLIPDVQRLPGFPETPRPEFASHLDAFLDAVSGFANPAGGPLPARDRS